MLPVKIKILFSGKRMREYRGIISFYETRIRKLCRAEFLNTPTVSEEAIALDVSGEEMSSEEFYRFILERSKNGREIIFMVGPPEGFKNIKNRKISLSRMTLEHDLAYLILLEQIYRSLLRMKGTNYEK